MTKTILAASAALMAAQPALAADFSFSFSTRMINGDTASGSGVLTTQDLGDGRFKVTGATGEFFGYEGDTASTPTDVFGPYDEEIEDFGDAFLFQSGGTWVTNGIGFWTTGIDYRFQNRNADNLYEFRASEGGANDVALTLSPLAVAVPEPATWATMLSGFALVGGALRRRQRAETLAA